MEQTWAIAQMGWTEKPSETGVPGTLAKYLVATVKSGQGGTAWVGGRRA